MKKSRLFLKIGVCFALAAACWLFQPQNAAASGWHAENGNWYYLSAQDAKATGWQKIGGAWYFFDSAGIMYKDRWLPGGGGNWYYFDGSGAMAENRWVKSGTDWYYMASGGLAARSGWQKIGAAWYCFENSGVMYKDRWLSAGSGNWYYFGAGGAMADNTWVNSGGTWYFMASGGLMTRSSWQKTGNAWYFLGDNGRMFQAQWLTAADGRWYYLDKNGVMSENCWLNVDGRWYFLTSGGLSARGLQQVGRDYYYFQEDAIMAASTAVTLGSRTYAFSASGKLASWTENGKTTAFQPILAEEEPDPYFVKLKAGYPLYSRPAGSDPLIENWGSSERFSETVCVVKEAKTAAGTAIGIQDGPWIYWVKKDAIATILNENRAFIELVGTSAQKTAASHDQFASVVVAQAILESGWGKSTLAKAPNYNLFGIKGSYNGQSVTLPTKEYLNGKWVTVQQTFKKYPSYDASCADRIAFIEGGGNTGNKDFYRGAFRSVAGTYPLATKYLTGRYATAPDYDQHLNRLIEKWDLTRFD